MCILLSCKSKNQNRTAPYQNNLGIDPATIAQIDSINYTTIEWDSLSKNFGVISYGDSVLIRFKFKNTGVHPLFLSSVRPSCGCTVPAYPKDAIMPGEKNELVVNFHSIGQSDIIHKTISVTSNTSNGVRHLLTIGGRVAPMHSAGKIKE
jgi:hypothetical protein